MAPGFDQLSDHDYDDELDEIDFSDLKERYDVRMEEGLDTFVVCMPEDTETGRKHTDSNRSSTASHLSTKTRKANSSSS